MLQLDRLKPTDEQLRTPPTRSRIALTVMKPEASRVLEQWSEASNLLFATSFDLSPHAWQPHKLVKNFCKSGAMSFNRDKW
jgi:hypothetical protein